MVQPEDTGSSEEKADAASAGHRSRSIAAIGREEKPTQADGDWSERWSDFIISWRARPLVWRLSVALVTVSAAFALRYLLPSEDGVRLSYAPFHIAVVISALTGGIAASLLAAVLAVTVTHVFFWPLSTIPDVVGLMTFVLTALLLGVIFESLRRVRLKLSDAELARQRDADLRLLIAQAPIAIAMFDHDMRYLAASDRWISDYRLTGRDIIGQSHYDVFPDIPDRWKDVHRRGLAGETIRADQDRFDRSDGSYSWERWEVRPWHTFDGQVGGITIFAETITPRIEAELALAASRADLARAQAMGRLSSWRLDIANNSFSCSDELCTYLGMAPGTVLTMEEADRPIHPDDLPRVKHVWNAALAGEPYKIEFRIVTNGVTRWVREVAEIQRDERGTPVQAFGTAQDVTEQKQAEEILRTSEERLRLALDAARMGIWDLDLTTGIDTWNDQTFRLIGFVPGSVTPSYSIWREKIHPDDRDRVDAEFMQSIESCSEHHSIYRVLQQGGEIRWIEARGRALKNAAGQTIRSFGVMMDITDRKKAEERAALLTAEVNHRAKNLLAVVQAVALQTAREDDPSEFADNFNERLAGLAACHDLLVQSEWRGIDTAELAKSQMQHFAHLIGTRIFFEGPAVELSAATAQALGMAIHELSTNASKHGALSSPEGTVRLAWEIKNGVLEPQFVMRWSEQNGPAVSEPKRRGFGHKVMVDMVEYSLDGTVTMIYSPAGFSWQVKAPTARVVSRQPIGMEV